jgi:SanA protein
MIIKMVNIILWTILIVIMVCLVLIVVPRSISSIYARTRTFAVQSAPEHKVAIVFGAGLWRDGRPTPVLRDRVTTAAELYHSGKVEKLLMSGDNSNVNYNEPGAMRGYALELGIPDEAIVLDYAGNRTYDTCYRAREIFGIKDAILVTQSFHLPRALYVCNHLGISADGVPADVRIYRKRALMWWNIREAPATLVALWEVHFSQPKPVLGEKEPIFPMEAQ